MFILSLIYSILYRAAYRYNWVNKQHTWIIFIVVSFLLLVNALNLGNGTIANAFENLSSLALSG